MEAPSITSGPESGFAPTPRAGFARSVLNLDSLIYVYGTWTVAYWIALAFGLGWHFALGLFIVFGALFIGLTRNWRIPQFDTSFEQADVLPLSFVFAVIIVWPIALELGRPTLGVVALVLLALRGFVPVVNRSFGHRDARLLAVGSLALLATLAFYVSWSAFVTLLCIIAIVTIVDSKYLHVLTKPVDHVTSVASTSDVTRLGRSWVTPNVASAALLAGLGVLIAVWDVGGALFWSDDNAYYLNKAAHFAASPTTFSIRDYMYGVGGATHYPMGDILLVVRTPPRNGISHFRCLHVSAALPTRGSGFDAHLSIRHPVRGSGSRSAPCKLDCRIRRCCRTHDDGKRYLHALRSGESGQDHRPVGCSSALDRRRGRVAAAQGRSIVSQSDPRVHLRRELYTDPCYGGRNPCCRVRSCRSV